MAHSTHGCQAKGSVCIGILPVVAKGPIPRDDGNNQNQPPIYTD